ncbi:MAG: ribosomal protein S18-alanine N-acetyltransferase [Magnetococcus sp. DMHC-1]|nr:ribosomal protein S18-alanine N-acetyltransferase [Magnetococcales bacterium]
MENLERVCFETNRLSRRNFRHLLTRGQAIFLTAHQDTHLLGYGLLLLRRNSPSARLYSLAIHPAQRRSGLGRTLLQNLEEAAVTNNRAGIHLEVRTDNEPAIAFYQKLGYRPFAIHHNYYADHQDACRMRKRLDIIN